MRSDRHSFHRVQAETAGAPAWTVTYADFVTVLLCLFVAILSMSTIKKDRFQTALGSLQQTFGADMALESADTPDQSLYGRLHHVIGKRSEQDQTAPNGEPENSWASITRLSGGAKLVLAGPTVFKRGRAELADDVQEMVAQIGREMQNRKCTVIVRGHCAAETAQDDQNARDLSYARAKSAAQVLEQAGVSAQKITVVAVGDGQPRLDHAYTEKRRAMNRRVEIEIMEGDEADEVIRLTSAEKG